ncbi:glycerophosphodiester phosphodiesterase family protein [Paenibacillus sp. JCM 10914]|uniref:glycerophosphodiester phosphodiesterase n=1 Tax=Paenibacillus sp. JCM 10914 TaxID=1236974 RepID=UPI0003CC3174|nr:glycerophosphodiester phosphodiesterase family protein [Paenibacillus sp. JCM 10914]GAE06077.1 glycerophosphoryl diester phosphodiesterase [Paenibacillus sp. JCM 10914]
MEVRGLAHRGYPLKYPENTMLGFQKALELGFSHIELDVQLTKDGVPVVIHDATVDRTTNGTGAIQSFAFEEIRQLDAGSGEKIPTLEEVLLFAKDRMQVDIELKQTGDTYPGLEQKVIDVIKQTGMEKQVFLTSFDHYSIQKARSIDPDIELGLVIYGATPSIFPFMEEIGARYISVKYVYVTPHFIEEVRKRGYQLVLWTPDDEPCWNHWLSTPMY